ncbi:hypothetical protein PROVRETT_07245 [Providencia rettgeri DSM 1131]|nr:hypothetical protein PROVRETT_07245 [Providencia rettgeri DSM 1131]
MIKFGDPQCSVYYTQISANDISLHLHSLKSCCNAQKYQFNLLNL